LREVRRKYKSDVDRAIEENQKLNRIVKQEEIAIKSLEDERNQLLELNENLKYENSNLGNVIKNKEDTITYNQRQLDESNKTILKLSGALKDLETQAEQLRIELNVINSASQKEMRSRIEREKTFEDLERLLRDKEKEMKKYLEQLDILSVQKEKLFEDNTRMYEEIDKLKNQLYKLSQQNSIVRLILTNLA
jgi:predicted  nucleic acid-binding Zn-ribbon protein